MRKLLIPLLFLFVICLTVNLFHQPNHPTPLPIEVPPAFEEDPYIQLTPTKSIYPRDISEITFSVTTVDPAVSYTAGDDWLLQRYTGGQWSTYDTAGDINSMGYQWTDGSTMTHTFDPIQDPGHYRLVKSIGYEDGRPTRLYPHTMGELTLYCYFEVQ